MKGGKHEEGKVGGKVSVQKKEELRKGKRKEGGKDSSGVECKRGKMKEERSMWTHSLNISTLCMPLAAAHIS